MWADAHRKRAGWTELRCPVRANREAWTVPFPVTSEAAEPHKHPNLGLLASGTVRQSTLLCRPSCEWDPGTAALASGYAVFDPIVTLLLEHRCSWEVQTWRRAQGRSVLPSVPLVFVPTASERPA